MEREAAPLVVDASIVVKWFVPEHDSASALKLRDAHKNGRITLFAPDLMPYELANALRYRAALSEADLKSAIESLFELDLTLITPSAKSISRTTSLARKLDVSVYDATYLELSETLECQVITSDGPFFEKVSKSSGEVATRIRLLRDFETMPA
jgi:predicted nucleic acid-binding protein